MLKQIAELLETDIKEIDGTDLDALRKRRRDCSHTESDISLVRRLTQGRLDIVGHEVQRRQGNESQADLEDVLFDIPSILSDKPSSNNRAARPTSVNEPGQIALDLIEELDTIVSPSQISELSECSDQVLDILVQKLESFEVRMSKTRRQLHEIIDGIQSEIARRYREGEASVDTLLQ